MILSTKMFVAAALLIAAVVFSVGGAFAQSNSGGTRPGWGFGDTNHTHTGPPGQSVAPGH